jgi:Pyridoxamine 5'-phosphate oxidase
MSWAQVAERLAAARTYWLGTTAVSGAPHAAPVWGAVTGGTLYLYSERSTVKARNLAIDPRVVVHLESGEDVLIVYGAAEDLGVPADVPSVVAALAAKYSRPEDRQYLPDADPRSTSSTRYGPGRRWPGAWTTTRPRSAGGLRVLSGGDASPHALALTHRSLR